MTRTLLKLQRVLWLRTMRNNPASGVMAVLVFFYALFGLLSIGTFIALGINDGAYSAIAGGVGVGTLAYVAVSVMLPSGEGQLSPVSFAIYPVRAQQLIKALALSTLLQSRGIAAVICTVVTTIITAVSLAATGHASAIIALIPAMILQFAITLMLGLWLNTTLGGASTRRNKERNTIIASFAFIIAYAGYFVALNSTSSGLLDLGKIGNYLMWTPFGAAGGIVTGVAQGSIPVALGCTVIALATLVTGTLFWLRAITEQLEAPLESVQKATKEEKHTTNGRVPLLLPGLKYNTSTMIFSRAATYLRRDSRFLGSMMMMPVFAAYFIYLGVTQTPGMLYFGAGVLALATSAYASNDFGYDGPANWLHIGAGVPARVLLPARHAGSSLITYSFLLIYLIVLNIIAPDHALALLLTPCIVGLAISADACSTWLSVFNPFPVAKPGTNPWQDKSGFSAAAMLAAFGTLLVGWFPSAPGIGLTLYGYYSGTPWATVLGVLLGVALPVAMYLLVMRTSTRRLDSHYPEIFAKVRAFNN